MPASSAPTPTPPPTAPTAARQSPGAPGPAAPVNPNATTGSFCPITGDAVAAAADDPAMLERVIESYRARCFALSVVELTLSILCFGVCWVAYGFTLLLAITLMVVSIILIVHFRTQESLRQSTCCCFPLNAIRQMHTAHIILTIFAVLSLACSAVQAGMKRDDDVTLVACIIDGVISLITLVVVVVCMRGLCILSTLCQQDDSFATVPLPPQPYGAYYAGAPPATGYVVGGPSNACLAPGAMPNYYAAGAPVGPHHHHPSHHQGYPAGAYYNAQPQPYYGPPPTAFAPQPVYYAAPPQYAPAGPVAHGHGSGYYAGSEFSTSHRATPAAADVDGRSPSHPPTAAAPKTV